MGITQQVFTVSMIGVWISVFLLNFLFTVFIKDKKQSWGNYWGVFLITLVTSGLILYFLITNADKFTQFVTTTFHFGNFTNMTN